jgi:hypothetical protein
LWVIFALLDPDPDSEYGSGSTGPIENGSNTDPDPKPCIPEPDLDFLPIPDPGVKKASDPGSWILIRNTAFKSQQVKFFHEKYN